MEELLLINAFFESVLRVSIYTLLSLDPHSILMKEAEQGWQSSVERRETEAQRIWSTFPCWTISSCQSWGPGHSNDTTYHSIPKAGGYLASVAGPPHTTVVGQGGHTHLQVDLLKSRNGVTDTAWHKAPKAWGSPNTHQEHPGLFDFQELLLHILHLKSIAPGPPGTGGRKRADWLTVCISKRLYCLLSWTMARAPSPTTPFFVALAPEQVSGCF